MALSITPSLPSLDDKAYSLPKPKKRPLNSEKDAPAAKVARVAISPLTQQNELELLSRVFPIEADSNGQLTLNLDPEVKKVTRVIYQFFRKIQNPDGSTTFKCLDGKTEDTLGNRINKYVFGMRHPEKECGKSQFFKDLRDHPEEFFFRIRRFVKPGEDINEVENECIIEDNAIARGYNKYRGKNGSNKFDPTLSPSPSKPIEPTTPQKSYPVTVDENGVIGIATTPGVEAKMNTVYGFWHIEKPLRYIGRSTDTIKHRFSNHKSSFNRALSEVGQRPFPSAVRQSPTKYKCGVYGQFKEGEDPSLHENHCAEVKIQQGFILLNATSTGGGGVSHNFGKRDL